MTCLPVAVRELGRAAQKPSTYRRRTTVGAIARILAALASLSGPTWKVSGADIFFTLGVLTLVFSLFAGLTMTSDSIASEREEGTLGLLFLTDLTGFDIVIGKLAAHSVDACFTLLAIFPVLGLSLLTGGVSGAEFVRFALVFLSTVFFSLCLGLAASAYFDEAKKALAAALGVMAIFAGFFPALWWLQGETIHVGWLDFLLYCSPVFTYMHSRAVGYTPISGSTDFWRSIISIWALSGGCLALASHLTPRLWKKSPKRISSPRASAIKKYAWKPADVGNPYFNVAMHNRGPSLAANRLTRVVFVVWFASLLIPTPKTGPPIPLIVCLALLGALHVAVKVFCAIEAGFRLNHDRDSGALEMLMTTPLTARQIVEGLESAQFRHFRESLFTLVAMNLVGILRIGMRDVSDDPPDAFIFPAVFGGGLVALAVDFMAVTGVARFNSIKRAKGRTAVLVSIATTVIPFWLFVLLPFICPRGVGGADGLLLLFTFLSVVYNFVAACFSRLWLVEGIRGLVTRQHNFSSRPQKAGIS